MSRLERRSHGRMRWQRSITDGGVPYGTQIRRAAEAEPDAVAIIFAAEDGTERLVTFREFDERSTQIARVLQSHGLEVGDFLCVSLPNSPEHLMSSFAGWKCGAVVVPMRWDLPEWERGRVLATMGPKLVVDAAHSEYFEEAEHASTDPLPEVVSPRGLAVCSSGSTGSPKVIVQKAPALYYPEVGLNMVVESYGALPQPQRVPGARAALPHQRIDGGQEPDGRRADRAVGAVQRRAHPRPH